MKSESLRVPFQKFEFKVVLHIKHFEPHFQRQRQTRKIMMSLICQYWSFKKVVQFQYDRRYIVHPHLKCLETELLFFDATLHCTIFFLTTDIFNLFKHTHTSHHIAPFYFLFFPLSHILTGCYVLDINWLQQFVSFVSLYNECFYVISFYCTSTSCTVNWINSLSSAGRHMLVKVLINNMHLL